MDTTRKQISPPTGLLTGLLGRLPWSALAFLTCALPLILINLRRGRGQFDQEVYHEPTIRRFASQLALGPGQLDLSDYLSATTPGYHLVMAAIAHWLTPSLTSLKLINTLFTISLLVLLERSIRLRLTHTLTGQARPKLLHLALIAPFACSIHVFLPGVWLQPDNAAWLGVLIIILLALRPTFTLPAALIASFVLLMLVWMRQSHAWAAGLMWVWAWLSRAPKRDAPPLAAHDRSPARALGTNIAWLIKPSRARLTRLVMALLLTIPALASIGWFANLWGGLTPPSFRAQHGGMWNLAAPAFAMSLMAIFSCFFIAWVWPGLVRLWSARRTGGWLILIACACIGLIAAAIPRTTFEYEPRATGLWNIVRLMDRQRLWINERTSPLILVLAPAGMIALAALLAQLPRRRACTYALLLIGFVAAQSANTNAWQRYFEPLILLILALIAADIAVAEEAPARLPGWLGAQRSRWIGPATLALLGIALTASTLWLEPIFVKDWPDHPLSVPIAPSPADPSTPFSR